MDAYFIFSPVLSIEKTVKFSGSFVAVLYEIIQQLEIKIFAVSGIYKCGIRIET